MKNKSFFVTGIDTDIGKTIVSAILVEALNADYWKPIQSGDLHYTDTDKVKELVNEKIILHPETYRLNNPLSPHASAKLDNISISLDSFQLPETNNNLIVEGAGGLLVPINEDGHYLSDIIVKLGIETLLVSKNYLGSINHTLLSITYLKSKGISIKGIIIVGEKNESSESIITKNTGVNILHRVPVVEAVTLEFIKGQAELLRTALN